MFFFFFFFSVDLPFVFAGKPVRVCTVFIGVLCVLVCMCFFFPVRKQPVVVLSTLLSPETLCCAIEASAMFSSSSGSG